MSCLFDALAHALSARVGLLRHARYATIRGMDVPVTGASVRAALCDVMPSVRVHGATLAECYAAVGAVGVRIASTFSKASSKSLAMSARTFCAFR